jgi:transposase
MSGYIPAVDRHQTVLLPDALDDFVGAENPVRVIDAFVDGLALADLGFSRTTPADTGRPGYDPRALLKLYVYGYLHRVRSSRRLERETQCNVEVMWLVRRLTPDHKTISDFRATHAAALPNVFRAFTVVCRQLELFGAELVGIDGTKLRAVNAKARSFTPPELRRHLHRIDARVKAYLAELDARDRTESAAAGAGAPAEPLRVKLARLEERQAEYQALLATMATTGAPQVTLTDPESRRMKTSGGTQVCYNAQIAVDAQHHLIVAETVTNEPTDVHQLSPMAEAAHEALGAPPDLAAVADRGYHNGPEVARCLAAGIVPMVPAPQTSKNEAAGRFTKAQFTYLPDADAYRCPAGQVLPFRFETEEAGAAQRYDYDYAACAGCPLRARCTGKTDPAQGRRIKRWGEEAILEAMAARLAADPGSRVRRKSLVEHPFGTMKRGDDASYFLVRGLAKVRGEFSLMALAYNLRRAVSVVGVPRLVAALRAGWRGGGEALSRSPLAVSR